MPILKKDPKIIHSFHKKRMPNSFSGIFFNRHRIQYESGALQTDSSEIFYFLPSTTDRVEEINHHMGPVNLYPIDMMEMLALIRQNSITRIQIRLK